MLEIDEVFINANDRRIFMEGLMRIVVCDKDFSVEENKMLINIGHQLGYDRFDLIDIRTELDDHPITRYSFNTRKQSLYFIFYALRMAHVDCDYCDAEKNIIQDYVSILGLSQEDYETIECIIEAEDELRARFDYVTK